MTVRLWWRIPRNQHIVDSKKIMGGVPAGKILNQTGIAMQDTATINVSAAGIETLNPPQGFSGAAR